MKINFPENNNGWIVLIVRIVIGGIFVYASIDKIIYPGEFAKIIHNYRLLPPEWINIMAIMLPWLELVTGACLIAGYFYRGANTLIMIMLIVFIGALGINYIRGVNISCGCFSASSAAKSNLLVRLIEDIFMLIGCLAIMFRNRLPQLSK